MLHRGLPATVALFGLLAGGVATAGDHRYGSEPQVRLGIDILWGGNGPVYVAPPVAWQPPPVHRPPRWAPPARGWKHGYERGYARGYDRGYDRAGWRRDDHRRHRHGRGRDDCDD